MDKKALNTLSYGLFILTAREGEKDNGCIINTAVQAASEPNQLSICVSKQNKTHDMIRETGAFTVSVLSLAGPFCTAVSAYFLLDQVPKPIVFVGALFMITGLLLYQRSETHGSKAETAPAEAQKQPETAKAD